MEKNKTAAAKVYFTAMAAYWLIFGLITAFYPALMDLFQSAAGVAAKTAFSDHVWRHDGFDILSLSVLLFALSRSTANRSTLMAAAIAAALVTLAIVLSLTTTPYWNAMFIVPCLGCFAFAIWGAILAMRTSTSPAMNS